MAKAGSFGGGVRRAEDIHFAEVGDEFFVTLERRDVVACLNRSAFELIENLDGFSDPLDVAEALAEAHGVAADEYVEAVREVCEVALEAGLLERVESSRKKRKPIVDRHAGVDDRERPRVVHLWREEDLRGGLFVSTSDSSIGVIVPNVTDGPIKTCPPHTCTVPAGLFTPETIIRTFDPEWRKSFEPIRRSGLVNRQHVRDVRRER